MIRTIYGEGGFCADCNPSHNHPLGNVLEQYDDGIEAAPDTSALAVALSQLPAETLDVLKAALGL